MPVAPPDPPDILSKPVVPSYLQKVIEGGPLVNVYPSAELTKYKQPASPSKTHGSFGSSLSIGIPSTSLIYMVYDVNTISKLYGIALEINLFSIDPHE